jgi:hypothetical protein
MKYLILLLILPFPTTVSAQDILSVELVDTPPQLKSEDFPKANEGADLNDLFLRGVYTSIKYPAYARAYGVPTVVSVTYLIDVDGKISIEKTSVFTPEEATKLPATKDEVITVTVGPVISCYSDRGPRGPVSPPSQAISEQRLAKAYTVLEEAASASIRSLPTFIPASHGGNPVVVRSTRFFSFRAL